MRAVLRVFVAALLAIGGLWAVAAPANAADSSSTCGASDGYVPTVPCQVLVDTASASCTGSGAAATFTYSLTSTVGTSSVTITFSSNGHTTSVSGQPLSGSIPWPSAMNGSSTTVTFTTPTDPTYVVSKTIATPACMVAVLAADPTSSTGVLAATGAEVGPFAGVALTLLIVGGLVFLASRRRRA